MTRPIFGNDPDVAKLARLDGRVGKVEHRAKTGPWVFPTLLNGATDIGAPYAPVAYRVNYGGLHHDFQGRLGSVTDGMVVFNILSRWRLDHDYEVATVAESGGVRSGASLAFDSTTGDVTIYLF